MVTQEETQMRVRGFLDAARWKTQEHRLTNRQSVDQLVRYTDNPPLDIHLELLAACSDPTPLTAGVWVDAKDLTRDGQSWRPVAAWIEEAGATDGSGIPKYKLVQVLRPAHSTTDDGPYVSIDGCMVKRSIRFVYAAAEVESIEGLSSSGMNVTLESIRRDDETGLYDYAVVTTETIEKDVGVYTAHVDQFSTRQQVTRHNLKEEAILDNKGTPTGDYKTFDEQAAAIASEHLMTTTSGGGIVVDVSVVKNEDCTADVTVVNTQEVHIQEASKSITKTARETETVIREDSTSTLPTADPALGDNRRIDKTAGGLYTIVETTRVPVAIADGEGSASVTKTLFQTSERSVKENQTDVTADRTGVAAAGGVVVRKDIVLLDNGRFNVETTTTTEAAVSNAVVVKTKTARGLRVETRDENQTEDFTTDPALGVSQRSERTQGALYNKTTSTTTATAIAAGEGNQSCSKTIFEHQHSTLAENQASATPEVSEAGDGNVYTRRVVLNDDGSYNIEETVTTEQKVEDAIVETSAVATSTTDRTTTMNAEAPLDVATSVGENGEVYTRRSEKTNGGLWRTVETRVRPIFRLHYYNCAESYNGSRQHGCIFSNATEAQLANLASSYASISFRLNDHGLYDGNAATTNPPYRSGAAFQPPIETFDQYTYTVTSRVVAHGEKMCTALIFQQIHSGVVYDSNITQDSANSPYTRMNGHQNWHVNHYGRTGEGYWTYRGVNWSREVWVDASGVVVFRGQEVGTRNLDVALPEDPIWSYING